MDVASGLPWLLVGTLGLLLVARTPARQHDGPFADGQERAAFGLLFGAVALTNGLISHTVKHACAVVAAIWLLRMMIDRCKESGGRAIATLLAAQSPGRAARRASRAPTRPPLRPQPARRPCLRT